MNEEAKKAKLDPSVAMKYIRQKQHTYDAMRRDGYWMPAFQSAICSREWFDKVRFDPNVWCPKCTEITVRNCADPPKKDKLIAILDRELTNAGKSIGVNLRSKNPKLPNK